MKHSLFQSSGKFYKANLHGHTTVSDGGLTPEEIKRIYKGQGYSVVAYTDHNVMVPHTDLNDEDFLAVTGMEYDYNEDVRPKPYSFLRTYHLLLLSEDPNSTYYPFPNPDYVEGNEWHNERKYIQPYYKGDYQREYSQRAVSELFADAHSHGFLTYYCHPFWSGQNYSDYCELENVDFVEVANTACANGGFLLDRTDRVFHDFLMLSKPVLPAASDDVHGRGACCGGGTYIKADALSYESIFDAIRRGDVYASWGPEIKELWYDPEARTMGIETAGVRELCLISERRYCWRENSEAGNRIFHAEFDIEKYAAETLEYGDTAKSFLRFVAVDFGGNLAVSRAYYLDELLKIR